MPDAGTISYGFFEFEPSFGINSHKEYFEDDWGKTEQKYQRMQSALQFRVSLGLSENIEAGASFSSEFDEVSLGGKINLVKNETYLFSIVPGIILPTTNENPFGGVPVALNYCYSAGVIGTYFINERSNLDIVLAGTYHSANEDYNTLITYGVGYGYYVTEKLFAVAEITGYSTYKKDLYSSKLSVNPGFTYQFNPHLLFVTGIQLDIAGKNETKGITYLTAFTMKF